MLPAHLPILAVICQCWLSFGIPKLGEPEASNEATMACRHVIRKVAAPCS